VFFTPQFLKFYATHDPHDPFLKVGVPPVHYVLDFAQRITNFPAEAPPSFFKFNTPGGYIKKFPEREDMLKK
jgi:hypothetical protein